MKLETYKITVFRRLPCHPGGDFAVVEIEASDRCSAEAHAMWHVAVRNTDDFDWRYSPIMLYYDFELELPTPAPKPTN